MPLPARVAASFLKGSQTYILDLITLSNLIPMVIRVVSYYESSTYRALFLAICEDSRCTPKTIKNLRDIGEVGRYTSLQLVDDKPIISYHFRSGSHDSLELYVCDDPACSSGNHYTVDDGDGTNNVGSFTSRQLNSKGNPAISYYDTTINALKVAVCDDLTCPNPAIEEVASGIYSPGPVTAGSFTSLRLDGNDNPIISYYDANCHCLKLAICSDPTCQGTKNFRTVDSGNDVGQYSSLQIDAAGHAIISYYDATDNKLKVKKICL